MGLLNNNNNNRTSKRFSLRKQLPGGYVAPPPTGNLVMQNSGLSNSTNPLLSPNANVTAQNAASQNAASQTTLPSSSGGNNNMMAYMSMAAAATPMVMGFMQGRKQKEIAEGLDTEILAQDKVVSDLMANRKEIRNPYANLSVATEAAEFQGQQTDQALANSLDAMQAGGFGAGGATALARAAAKSKQGISADIQKQEATNQKFFAQGEQLRQNMQEDRDIDEINFEISDLDNMEQRRENALAAQQASNATGVGGSLDAVGSIMKNPEAMSALTGLFGG